MCIFLYKHKSSVGPVNDQILNFNAFYIIF